MDLTLTRQEKVILLATARAAMRQHLGLGQARHPEPTETLRQKGGAFVTLHSSEGRLRGCIGQTVASDPLIDTVRKVAVSSAFHDPRFPPVTADELEGLELEISVLSPLRRIADIGEIEVGRNGILLRQGVHSGLLLPQVATENGWDRETFLDHTCLKAGLSPGCWRAERTHIETFAAIVFNEAAIKAQ